MINTNIFEVAVRNKLRFPFRGQVSVEDLWDLNVENLDSVYKTLSAQLKTVKEESLLNTKTKEDKELDFQIEIVKYIVKTKLEEREVQLEAREKKAQKQKVLEILSAKKDEALQGKTIEELEAMLEE